MRYSILMQRLLCRDCCRISIRSIRSKRRSNSIPCQQLRQTRDSSQSQLELSSTTIIKRSTNIQNSIERGELWAL